MTSVVEFHELTVTNEQTRATWSAERGEVRQGLIVVSGTPPGAMFDHASHTYTIVARDRGQRVRTFRSLVVARIGVDDVTFR